MIKRLAGRCRGLTALATVAALFSVVDVASRALGERLQRFKESRWAGLSVFDAWQVSGMPAIAGGAFSSGKDGVFKLDSIAPSLTDISQYLTSVDFPRSRDLPETTTLGKNSRTYVKGLKGSKITLNFNWDPTIVALLDGAYESNAAVTQSFEYGPQGSTGGFIKYLGECLVGAVSEPASVDGVLSGTCELTITGDVTVTTW